jgi:hypothetical protein
VAPIGSGRRPAASLPVPVMSKLPSWVGRPLAAAAVVGLALAAVRLDPAGPAPSRFGRGDDDFSGEEDLRRQNEELEARCQAAHRRAQAKWEVAGGLVRGEVGLREAAERFRVIVGSDTGIWKALRSRYPAATDDEVLYRHAIDFARSNLFFNPGSDPTVLSRLEAELASAFPARMEPPTQ